MRSIKFHDMHGQYLAVEDSIDQQDDERGTFFNMYAIPVHKLKNKTITLRVSDSENSVLVFGKNPTMWADDLVLGVLVDTERCDKFPKWRIETCNDEIGKPIIVLYPSDEAKVEMLSDS